MFNEKHTIIPHNPNLNVSVEHVTWRRMRAIPSVTGNSRYQARGW